MALDQGENQPLVVELNTRLIGSAARINVPGSARARRSRRRQNVGHFIRIHSDDD